MKNKMLKLLLSGCAAVAMSPVWAAGPTGSGPNPYSDCGIGAALFKDTEWAAVTSNVIWDLGTTALTSATASPETCSKKNVKAAMFIRDSYAQLIEEAARGQGEHLAAALDIFECGAAQQNAASMAVRGEVGDAVAQPGFNAQTPIDKAGQLYNIIDKAARQQCAV